MGHPKYDLLASARSSQLNELAKSLHQSFELGKLIFACISDLATVHSKLMIKQNSDTPLDTEVSDETLSQLTKTICDLGDLDITNEMTESGANENDIEEQLCIIKEFIQKKKSTVHLDEKKKQEKQGKIDSYRLKLKELLRECNQKMKALSPELDHDQQMQDGFCIKEREKNSTLMQEFEALRRAYPCFEDIRINAMLDQLAEEMDSEYTRLVDPITANDGTCSRLSFSFDDSSYL